MPFRSSPTRTQPVSSYFPLTQEQIQTLIARARELYDAPPPRTDPLNKALGEISSIQVRLAQNIEGLVVPYPTRGPIAKKKRHLDRLFITGLRAEAGVEEFTGEILKVYAS